MIIDHVYRVDRKFPDPYQVREVINDLASDPQKKKEYGIALQELKNSGLSSHPLLRQFSVES